MSIGTIFFWFSQSEPKRCLLVLVKFTISNEERTRRNEKGEDKQEKSN